VFTAYTLLTDLEAAVLSNASMWLFAADNIQASEFSHTRDQTLWPLPKKPFTTDRRERCHNLPDLQAATPQSGGRTSEAWRYAPLVDFQADRGCSVGRPYYVQSDPVLHLPTACLDGSPLLYDKKVLSTYTPEDLPATGQPQVETSMIEAPPASPHVKSSTNNSQRPSLPNGRSSRVSHSHIERRYRNNIKLQLDALTTKLPAMRDSYACTPDGEDSHHTVKGPSKALVIAAAVKHIESLETDTIKTKKFIKALQEQIEGLQGLVRESDCAIRRHLQANGISQMRRC
jgi:hypothetical protein